MSDVRLGDSSVLERRKKTQHKQLQRQHYLRITEVEKLPQHSKTFESNAPLQTPDSDHSRKAFNLFLLFCDMFFWLIVVLLFLNLGLMAHYHYTYLTYVSYSSTLQSVTTEGDVVAAAPVKLPIAVLGLIISLNDVDPNVWDAMSEWCAAASVELYITFKEGELPEGVLSQCDKVELLAQEPSLPTNRIERIARLRDQLREAIKGKAHSAVVVMDMDVEELPGWLELQDAVNSVQDEKGIVCSNGYEMFLGMRQVYDLFPFLHLNGEWPWEQMNAFNQIAIMQPRLFLQIAQSEGLFPVRSCFSGMAVYNAMLYSLPDCSYSTYPNELTRYADAQGKVCEHLVLHECFRFYREELQVAVKPDMYVERTCLWTCRLIPPIVYFVTLIGLWIARRQLPGLRNSLHAVGFSMR